MRGLLGRDVVGERLAHALGGHGAGLGELLVGVDRAAVLALHHVGIAHAPTEHTRFAHRALLTHAVGADLAVGGAGRKLRHELLDPLPVLLHDVAAAIAVGIQAGLRPWIALDVLTGDLDVMWLVQRLRLSAGERRDHGHQKHPREQHSHCV